MDSHDTAHVPPPNPENYWEFTVGEEKKISRSGTLSLKLVTITSTRVFMEMQFKGRYIKDWLNLDRPCVALRHPSGAPFLTLTLRATAAPKAWLQITHTTQIPRVAPQLPVI